MVMADGGFDMGTLTHRVREELARRRISRQRLADDARISLSTLEKGLSGQRPFTFATLVRLEQALDISLRDLPEHGQPAPTRAAGTASGDLGSYTRAAVTWLEGDHLTLRPSFGEAAAVYAYRTTIRWDDTEDCLTFSEGGRVDKEFAQFGNVAIPHQSGHIYLVTNRHGQHRMVVLTRPLITGEMFGVLTTLQAGQGAHLMPTATPIVLRPVRDGETPSYGRVTRDDVNYAAYRTLLDRTIGEGFAQVLT
ncbi:MAG: helix-turn-helix transcriptional regulator [Pseudomonadota bacterium]